MTTCPITLTIAGEAFAMSPRVCLWRHTPDGDVCVIRAGAAQVGDRVSFDVTGAAGPRSIDGMVESVGQLAERQECRP